MRFTADNETSHLYDRFERSSANGNGYHVEDDRGIGNVVGDLTKHAQQLVRGELDLFKAELTEKGKALGVYLGMAAAGLVLALIALELIGHTLVYALDLVMPRWTAFGIVTLLYLAGAAALAMAAKKGIEKTELAPQKSVESAKEDIQWVKTHS